MSQIFVRIAVVASLLAFLNVGASAQDDVALDVVIHGDMSSYTLDQLEELEEFEVMTTNDFVDGMVSFSGPLVRTLLGEDIDMASEVTLTAANEYQVQVPVSDYYMYNVILATRMAGERLSRRDKGPVWVIYPQSDHPELRDNTYNARLIWQLRSLEVR